MNDNEDYEIYCTRCGSIMKKSARCCMKCGNLNMENPLNNKMSQFVKDDDNSTNKYYFSFNHNSGLYDRVNSNDLKACFIINMILFIFILFSNILISSNFFSDFNSLLSINFFVINISFSITFLLLFAYEIFFFKLGYYWWKAIIPFYNIYLLSKRVFNKGFLFILTFIPIIGELYLLVLLYKLGTKFGKSGILFALIPYIMIPIISYGEYSYDNLKLVSDDDNSRIFKFKKCFLTVSFIVIFISIICILFVTSYFDVIVDYFVDRWKEVKDIFGI